jgi:hypothetical protein
MKLIGSIEKFELESMRGSRNLKSVRIAVVGVVDDKEAELLINAFKAKKPIEVSEFLAAEGFHIALTFGDNPI